MEKIKAFKQFGQYRTGTCVCAIVVRETFGVAVYPDQMGFKHNPYSKEEWDNGIRRHGLGNIDVRLLISIKHPYSWIVSMKNFQGSVHAFHRGPMATTGGFAFADGSKGRNVDRGSHLCLTYNNCYKSWLNAEYDKVVVPYEQLLTNLDDLMSGMQVACGLEMQKKPELPRNVIAPHEQVMHSALFDATFYTEKRYMEMLSADDKRAADEKIDWDMIAPFGYAKD